MKLKDISPKTLKNVPDTELSSLHLRCHQLYGETKEFTKDDIVKIHVWILNEMRHRGIGYLIRDNALDRRSAERVRKEGRGLKDFEYLLHHVHVDEKGKEEIHHCLLCDHMANMFEQGHLVVKDGMAWLEGKEVENGVFHVIRGLESKQEVVWSDEEAKKHSIKPKEMKEGMTLKEKAKEW